MSIRSVLFSVLENHVAVSTVVGARIYALSLPQNPALPAITGQIINTNRAFLNHNGPTGEALSTVQIDCYAGGLAEVHDLSQKVIKALRSLSGTYYGTRIFYIRPVGELELSDPDLNEFRITLDFEISYKEN